MPSPSTAQVIEFQAALSRLTDEEGALRTAVERAATTLDAEAAAIVDADGVVLAIGLPPGELPWRNDTELDVPGVGRCHVALAEVDGDPARFLLLARAAPFGADEHALIHGMARMLSTALRVVRLTGFASAFEDVDVGMALVDTDGRFSRLNGKLASIIGRGPDALIGTVYHELLHADDRAASERAFASLRSSDLASVVLEHRVRDADGSLLWLQVTVSRAHDGAGFVVQAHDVTQRREAESALRQSEDRYRKLVEHLPLVVFRNALGAPGTDLYVSPQVETLLGYTVDAWRSDDGLFHRIVHPDDRAHVYAALTHVLNTGDDLSVEYRVEASDGRLVTVRQEGVVLRDDRGVPLCVQGYIIDISEQRQHEQQLRLGQKLEAVGELAAGIAHEINTPIQFVGDSVRFAAGAMADLMGLIEAYRETIAAAGLQERVREAEEAADLDYLRERLPAAFERMDDGVGRVAGIVGAMREFSHPRGDGHSRVDVNAGLESTLVVSHSQYKHVADLDKDLGAVPPVVGDAGELNQVFVNLIVNAAHAIGDKVRGTGERGVIRVATRHDGDDVVITIADTGGGIADEHRERIFDPFFTTKEIGRGTGQGLAISRAIVTERHGGAITVRSEVGRGTTFEIRLPVDAAAELPAAA